MTGFSYSLGYAGAPLHAAAHSHHPWPDVSFAAQKQAWCDAARMLDRKWGHILETVVPAAQTHVARQLNLPDPATIVFGPNTHGFVLRLLSCLPQDRAPRILTTDCEFMSFARQIARLEEDGSVRVTRIGVQPIADFETRFADAARTGEFDLIFFSQVFFDTGFAIRDPASIANAVAKDGTLIVIDGYHAFMARPVDLGPIADRVFYLAGGYKYAMAGEGACFLHCPPGYGERPRDTGWYAGFSALEGDGGGVAFAKDASRLFGATFDSSGLYRFNAVQDWLLREGRSVETMLAHARRLEQHFLSALGGNHAIQPAMLSVPDAAMRGRFLSFRTPRAGEIVTRLSAQNIIADHRGENLRIGFGIYNSDDDVTRLAEALRD